MCSFGTIAIDITRAQISFLIWSANARIEGVPGFGFIVANRRALESSKGHARTLSLDFYDRWSCM